MSKNVSCLQACPRLCVLGVFAISSLPLHEPAGRAPGYAAAPVRVSRAAQPLTASSVSGVTVVS